MANGLPGGVWALLGFGVFVNLRCLDPGGDYWLILVNGNDSPAIRRQHTVLCLGVDFWNLGLDLGWLVDRLCLGDLMQ